MQQLIITHIFYYVPYYSTKEVTKMCNTNSNILYIVNKNTVKTGLEPHYISFIEDLNQYLLATYPEYYLGLQLYQDKDESNVFYVVSYYKEAFEVYKIERYISDYISRLYESVWGNSVERMPLVSSFTSTRILH